MCLSRGTVEFACLRLAGLLYVSPNRRSFHRLVQIYRIPFFQCCITEVRFICYLPLSSEICEDTIDFKESMRSELKWAMRRCPSLASDDELMDHTFEVVNQLLSQHGQIGSWRDWVEEAG